MEKHKVVSRNVWLKARLDLLAKEKAFSKSRDELTQERQGMPWVEVEKTYLFDGPNGKETLSDLFGGKSQLIIYHFMFDPEWDEGCKSCSLVADHINPSAIHLVHRDVSLIVASQAPYQKLAAFKERMGWGFKWVSASPSDFNRDFEVSFTAEELQDGVRYNYRDKISFPATEAPGVSVFAKSDEGNVFHTYSAYARGLENLIGAYALLDLAPKGRDETGLSFSMEWIRLNDSYED